jgi:SAM-dependent methyltransferase
MIRSETSNLITPRWCLSGSAPALESAPRAAPADDLFERTAWLYALFRDRLFRDDTERIVSALWPDSGPTHGTVLLEVGCGPGLYARRLAARCPSLRTVGIDRSWRLLELASERAVRERVRGCRFERGDALALGWPEASVDAVVASRLFTVVDGMAALAEVHRVLRPGGRCFLAEPASAFGTVVPLLALRLAGWLVSPGASRRHGRPAPRWPGRLSHGRFAELVASQRWGDLRVTLENGYHYAVCTKATERLP